MVLHQVSNICIVGVPGEEREKVQKAYFKKFPNLGRDHVRPGTWIS